MYADDHQAYVSGITLQNVQNQLQEVGDEITVWYDQNLLQGNFKKYQTITFGSDIKYPDKAINIKIGLEDIEQKDEMKSIVQQLYTTFDSITYKKKILFLNRLAKKHLWNVKR